MNFQQQVELARTASFIERVQGAMVKSAIAVSSEDPATDAHTTRVQWATQVLRDPAHYAARMSYGVAAQPTVTADILDAALYDVMSSVWNAYAGVVTQPSPEVV